MENMNKCPCCPHHCDRNNLQCGKGEAYFNGEANPESVHTPENHGGKHHNRQERECCRHGGERHGHQEGQRRCQHGDQRRGHRRPEFPAGSLAELLAKCGHRLFHGGDESMFAVLSEEESGLLKKLLSKLVSE